MGVLFWCQKSILIFYQYNSDVHVIIIILFFFLLNNKSTPPHKEKQMKKEK